MTFPFPHVLLIFFLICSKAHHHRLLGVNSSLSHLQKKNAAVFLGHPLATTSVKNKMKYLLNQGDHPADGGFLLFHKRLKATCQLKWNLLPNYKYSISYSAYCGVYFHSCSHKYCSSVCPCLCELGLTAFSFFTLLLDEHLVTRFITVCHARAPSCSLWLCPSFVLGGQPLFDSSKPFRSQGMLCVSACVLVQSSWLSSSEISRNRCDFSKEKYSFQSLL